MPLAVPAAFWAGLRRRARLRGSIPHNSSRAQLHAVLADAPIGLVQLAASGRMTVANTAFRAMAGLGSGRLTSRPLQELMHSDDRPRFRALHAAVLATGRTARFSGRLIRSGGTMITVALTMAAPAVPARYGRPGRIVASVQAVPRPVSNGGARPMDMLGQLAGGVAHDFNNVLQAIAGGARLMQRRVDDPATIGRLAALMVEAAERGAMVTDRLLSFAGRSPLRPVAVDTAVLLRQTAATLIDNYGNQMIVRVDVASAMPALLVDRTRMEVVLLGLGTNARDAMIKGRGTPSERAECRLSAMPDDGQSAGLPAGRYVRVDVADTGPGMTAETLGLATEPFFTTKPRGRGTGLGLAMAQGFAEQSGGRLMLTSAAGHGTVATLVLPAATDPGHGPRGRVRIMLVDDDKDVRDVMAELLDSCGFAPVAFDGAAAALASLDAGTPADLLITDLSMPVTNGMTLIREARQRRPGLPAILMTGYASAIAIPAEELLLGQITMVEKPVRTADLVAVVAQVLAPPED